MLSGRFNPVARARSIEKRAHPPLCRASSSRKWDHGPRERNRIAARRADATSAGIPMPVPIAARAAAIEWGMAVRLRRGARPSRCDLVAIAGVLAVRFVRSDACSNPNSVGRSRLPRAGRSRPSGTTIGTKTCAMGERSTHVGLTRVAISTQRRARSGLHGFSPGRSERDPRRALSFRRVWPLTTERHAPRVDPYGADR